MKEFRNEERLHFTLNVGDEEHAVALHMNQIVLWRDQYGAHLLGMRRFLDLCPESVATCPAESSRCGVSGILFLPKNE